MITCRLAGLSLALLVMSPPCEAVSPERGRMLYDNFCYHCHISQIHHRAASDIRAWADLIRAVANWQAEMGLGWTAEDVVDVASWLDRTFYGLADAPRAQ